MEFSSIIFPAPKPSYQESYFNDLQNDDEFYKYDDRDSLIFINSFKYDKPEKKHFVPCTFLPYFDNQNYSTKNFLIYLHGNAEDIGLAYDFATVIRDNFQMNVISMEYPGYGLYKEYEPSEEQICCDADNLLKYIKTLTSEQNIFLFGRSMGSGSSCYLASKNANIGGLIMMSAYTSIREVADGLVTKALSWLVKDRFRNIDAIQHVKCPVLLIHGKDDSLINFSHSERLFEKIAPFLKSTNRVLMHLSDKMTHNDFNTQKDIIEPLQEFFKKYVNQQAQINESNYANLQTDFSKFKIPQFIKYNTKPQLSNNYSVQNIQQQQFQQQQYQQQLPIYQQQQNVKLNFQPKVNYQQQKQIPVQDQQFVEEYKQDY